MIAPAPAPLCRDIEFDLEEDRECCLYGLNTPLEGRPNPSDVRRVTQIFKKPRFFHEGPNWSDVIQGDIGNCWFLSGVTTVATMPGLVEKFCVARDEEVGVYGFTFQRDGIWTDVIVSDTLTFFPAFSLIPLYHRSMSKPRHHLSSCSSFPTADFIVFCSPPSQSMRNYHTRYGFIPSQR